MAYTTAIENHLVAISRRLPLLIGYDIPCLPTPSSVLLSQSAAPEKKSRCYSTHFHRPITAPVINSYLTTNTACGLLTKHDYKLNQKSFSSDSFRSQPVEKYKYRKVKKPIKHYEFKSHKVKPKTTMVFSRCMSHKSGLAPGPLYNTKYKCIPKKVARTEVPETEEPPIERGMAQEKVEQRLRRQAALVKKRQWEDKQKLIEEREKELKCQQKSSLKSASSSKLRFESVLSKPALNELKGKIMASQLANNIRKPFSELQMVQNRPLPGAKEEVKKEENQPDNLLEDNISTPQHPSPFLNTSSNTLGESVVPSENKSQSIQVFSHSATQSRRTLDISPVVSRYSIKCASSKNKNVELPSPFLVKKADSQNLLHTDKKDTSYQQKYFDFIKRVNSLKEDRLKLQMKKSSKESVLPMQSMTTSHFKSNVNQARKQSSLARKESRSFLKSLYEKKLSFLKQELHNGPPPLNELNNDGFLSEMFNLFKSKNSTSLLKRALSTGRSDKPWKNTALNEENDNAYAPNIIGKYIDSLAKKKVPKQPGESSPSKEPEKPTSQEYTDNLEDKGNVLAKKSDGPEINQNVNRKQTIDTLTKPKAEVIEAKLKEKLNINTVKQKEPLKEAAQKPPKKSEPSSEVFVKADSKSPEKIVTPIVKKKRATVEPRPKLEEGKISARVETKDSEKLASDKVKSDKVRSDSIKSEKATIEKVKADKVPATTSTKAPSINPGGIWKSDRHDQKTVQSLESVEMVLNEEKLPGEVEKVFDDAHPDERDYQPKKFRLEASAKIMEAELWDDAPPPRSDSKWEPPSIWATKPIGRPVEKAPGDSKYPSAPPPPVVVDKVQRKTESVEKGKAKPTQKPPLKPIIPDTPKDDSSPSSGKKASPKVSKIHRKRASDQGASSMVPCIDMTGPSGKKETSISTVELLKALQKDKTKTRLPPSILPSIIEKKDEITSFVCGDGSTLFHRVYNTPTETRVITLSVDSIHEIRTEAKSQEYPTALISRKDSLDYFSGKAIIDPSLLKKMPVPKFVYSRDIPVRRKLKIPKQISEPIPFKYDHVLKQTSSEPIDFGMPSSEKKLFPYLLETASEPVDVGYNLPKMYEYKSPWISSFLSSKNDGKDEMLTSAFEQSGQESVQTVPDETARYYNVPYTPGDTIAFPSILAGYGGYESMTESYARPSNSGPVSMATSEVIAPSFQEVSLNTVVPSSFNQTDYKFTSVKTPPLHDFLSYSSMQETKVVPPAHNYYVRSHVVQDNVVQEPYKPVEHLLQNATVQAKNQMKQHSETPELDLAQVEGTQEEVVRFQGREQQQTSMKMSGRDEAFFPKDVNYIASHIPSNAGGCGDDCDEFRRRLLEEACYCETVTISVKPSYPEPPPSEFYSRHNPCQNVETWVPSFRSVDRGDTAAQVLLYKVKNNIYKFKCHSIDAWNNVKAGLNVIFSIFTRKQKSEVCHTYEDKLVNMQMSPDRPPCYWVCPPPCCPDPCKKSVLSKIRSQTGCKRCYTGSAVNREPSKVPKLPNVLSENNLSELKRSFSTTPTEFKFKIGGQSPLEKLQKLAEKAYKLKESLRTETVQPVVPKEEAPGQEMQKEAPSAPKESPKNCSSVFAKRYMYMKNNSSGTRKTGLKDTKSAYPKVKQPARNSLLSRTPLNMGPKPNLGCHGMASVRTPVRLDLASSSVRTKSEPRKIREHQRPSGDAVSLHLKSTSHQACPKAAIKNPYKSFADYINAK